MNQIEEQRIEGMRQNISRWKITTFILFFIIKFGYLFYSVSIY